MAHDLLQFKPGLFNTDMIHSRSGGAPRTIMLIHGMWSRPVVWRNFRHYFEARGHRVVTPTLRHHDIESGEAPDPALATTSLLDYAADLEREIRLLDEKPVLIGHSMGGSLAQILAARGLASGVVLLATAHCAPIFAFNSAVLRFFASEMFMKPFWRMTILPSYDVMRQVGLNGMSECDARNHYATLIPESGRAAFELAFWYFDKTRAALVDANHVTCPMLMLTGADDRLTPRSIVQRTADYFGDRASLEILPGHAHWLPLEAGWQEIAARALEFVESDVPFAEMERGATEAAPLFMPQPI